MRVLLIAGRELRSFFHTTVGWLILAGFLLLAGLFWATGLTLYDQQSMDLLYSPHSGYTLQLGEHLLTPYFMNLSVLLLLLCPAITMRLFSKELDSGTMELLFTSPVSTWEIVWGKYLGALGFVLVLLLGTAYVPLMLGVWADPSWGLMVAGYAAVGLVCAAVLAVGLLCSAATRSQVVALVSAFAASLAIWVFAWVGGNDPDAIWTHLSIPGHVDELFRGVLRLSDVVYFLGFIGLFLFATHQRVEAYRWR